MKRRVVEVGATYAAKVSRVVVPVRILRASPHGGWDAINTLTSREVRIKTAGKLRYRMTEMEVAVAEYEGTIR